MSTNRIWTLAATLLAAAPAVAALPEVTLPRAITDPRDPDERAVNCAAYLGHEINAMPPTRRSSLITAMRAWRLDLERRRPANEAGQYFASTFAVLRDAPPRVRHAAAAYCRAHAPGTTH